MFMLSYIFLAFLYVLSSAPMAVIIYILYKKIDDRDVIAGRKQVFFTILVTLILFPHPIALSDGQTIVFTAHASTILLSLISWNADYYAPWTVRYSGIALLITGTFIWLASLKLFPEGKGGYGLKD